MGGIALPAMQRGSAVPGDRLGRFGLGNASGVLAGKPACELRDLFVLLEGCADNGRCSRWSRGPGRDLGAGRLVVRICGRWFRSAAEPVTGRRAVRPGAHPPVTPSRSDLRTAASTRSWTSCSVKMSGSVSRSTISQLRVR